MSAWNHSICDVCWALRSPGRNPVRVLREAGKPGVYRSDTCCFCGKEHASGIYVRQDPRTVTCSHRKP